MSDIACPLCVGILDDECTECFGRGFISAPKKMGENDGGKDAVWYGLDLPGEEWKTIPEYESYHVSNRGRVLNITTGRVLRLGPNSDGLVVAKVYKAGLLHGFALHRLVASLFLPDFDKELNVAFKDGVSTNCDIDNLYQTAYRVRGKNKTKKVA